VSPYGGAVVLWKASKRQWRADYKQHFLDDPGFKRHFLDEQGSSNIFCKSIAAAADGPNHRLNS
jgi:hypothetical protein